MYANLSRTEVLAALKVEGSPVYLAVEQLMLRFVNALAEGIDPYTLLTSPTPPIEQVALELVEYGTDEDSL